MSARQGISCRRWSALSHSRAVNTERERRSGRGECQPGRASLVGGGQHCHTAGLSTQRERDVVEEASVSQAGHLL